jgi:hypothetical protein
MRGSIGETSKSIARNPTKRRTKGDKSLRDSVGGRSHFDFSKREVKRPQRGRDMPVSRPSCFVLVNDGEQIVGISRKAKDLPSNA